MGKECNTCRTCNKCKSLLKNRNTVQGLATLASNPYIPNFFSAKLYTGNLKKTCVPGLNCYSCPAATGACPIGAFQAVVGSPKHNFSYYILGIGILFGVLFGRFICGFLCPFGWFQDLLHKIPGKKLSTKKLKALTYLKYAILAIFVIALPIFWIDNVGMSSPYFCKLICPQGILEGGIPLSIADPNIRAALGKLFTVKFMVLMLTIVLSIVFYRPFCKWICPLGAFYALFNRISMVSYHFDKDTCINCGLCRKACKMDVDITQNQAHTECIRCAECVKVCPTASLSIEFGIFEKNKKNKGINCENSL